MAARLQLSPFKNEKDANDALRAVTDEATFEVFRERLAETAKSQPVRLLVRKRSQSEAFGFVRVEGKPDRVDFMYADGASTGRARWHSLSQSLKVKFLHV